MKGTSGKKAILNLLFSQDRGIQKNNTLMYWIWYTPITLYYDDVEIDNETNKDSNDNQTGKTTRGLASGGADKNKVNEEKNLTQIRYENLKRISFCCRILTTLKLLREKRKIILMWNLRMNCHHLLRYYWNPHGKKIEKRNHLNIHESLTNFLTNDGSRLLRAVTCII